MRTRNFLLCVILTGFSLTVFAQKIGALNLLTNIPVKITKQKVIPKQVKTSLGIAYKSTLNTKAGTVYEISISR